MSEISSDKNISDSISVMELSNEIQIASEFWKQFNLEAKRETLDGQVLEMKELKTASTNGRKRLNEVTRSFRSKSSDEQVLIVLDVLKAYQEEIDQLSKRSKFSESAFYSMYKSIYDAPDPVKLIEGITNQMSSSSTYQLEIERLKNELRQYELEFQQLKNQDITIRRLETVIEEYKNGIEDKVNEAVSFKTNEIEEACAAQIRVVKESHKALEKRLAGAVESMKHAQESADRAQSHLFEANSQAEMRISALQSENAILAEGSSRAEARVSELEREIEELKALANGNASSQTTLSNTIREESNQTLHLLISELQQDLRKKEETFRNDKKKLEASQVELTQSLSIERNKIDQLNKELSLRPSTQEYVSLKRQLKVLHKVVFNVEEEEDDGSLVNEDSGDPEHSSSSSSSSSGGGGPGQLEALLASRLKSLESELAESKRVVQELRDIDGANKENIKTLRSSLDSSAVLIARLENELEQQTKYRESSTSSSSSSSGNGIGSGLGLGLARKDGLTMGSNPPLSARNNASAIGALELSELLGVNMNLETTAGTVTGVGTGAEKNKNNAGDGESSHMVAILQGQRDRYKEKMTKAESALFPLQQQLDSSNATKQKLENDNIALYSEIRYLKSLGSSSSSSSSAVSHKSNYPFSPKPATRITKQKVLFDEENFSESEREREARYSKLYESRMSPFAQFSHNENQRKLAELSVADRIVLNTTMACISSHTGRKILMGYVITMHVLVFITLYYTAHRVHCDPTFDHSSGQIQ